MSCPNQAPAMVASLDGVQLQSLLDTDTFAAALPVTVMLLDREHRVVYANHRECLAPGIVEDRPFLGLRPGHLFRCEYEAMLEKCGCHAACQACGVRVAVEVALREQQPVVREVSITTTEGRAREYRIWASPIQRDGQSFVLCSILDIEDQKRREALERTFFHDLLNTAGGIQNVADLLPEFPSGTPEHAELLGLLKRINLRLIDEIRSARCLAEAERDRLQVNRQVGPVRDLLESVQSLFSPLAGYLPIPIEIDAVDTAGMIETDFSLLGRSLINLTKNAIEASQPGNKVRLSVHLLPQAVCFTVHSETVIPREVQRGIFHRNASTKGPGRGLGTYSVRLYIEHYLGGRVSFTSHPAVGTTFRIELPQPHA